MKRIILFVLLITFFTACNKDDDKRTPLTSTFFELDDCFSTMSLNGAEVVITDEQSYQEFQDTIRRHFFEYCDTVSLPDIDFTKSIFMGKYTQTGGCSVEYNRAVYYNVNSNSYDYEITVTQVGTCEMLIVSFNCAIVPKQSDSENVSFSVSHSYKDE